MYINAANQVNRKDSVFSYYRELIRLRKGSDLIVHGDFEMLCPESSDIFAYVRTLDEQMLLVVCNFTDHEKEFALPKVFEGAERLIGNYGELADFKRLRPYEAYALCIAE